MRQQENSISSIVGIDDATGAFGLGGADPRAPAPAGIERRRTFHGVEGPDVVVSANDRLRVIHYQSPETTALLVTTHSHRFHVAGGEDIVLVTDGPRHHR